MIPVRETTVSAKIPFPLPSDDRTVSGKSTDKLRASIADEVVWIIRSDCIFVNPFFAILDFYTSSRFFQKTYLGRVNRVLIWPGRLYTRQ